VSESKPPFYLDENPDVDVGVFLDSRGHEVINVKRRLGEGTPDPQVLLDARRYYGIIVTRDIDFERLAYKAIDNGPREGRTWGLLRLECKAPMQAARVRELYEIIIAEMATAKARWPTGLLLHMDIRDRAYIIHR